MNKIQTNRIKETGRKVIQQACLLLVHSGQTETYHCPVCGHCFSHPELHGAVCPKCRHVFQQVQKLDPSAMLLAYGRQKRLWICGADANRCMIIASGEVYNMVRKINMQPDLYGKPASMNLDTETHFRMEYWAAADLKKGVSVYDRNSRLIRDASSKERILADIRKMIHDQSVVWSRSAAVADLLESAGASSEKEFLLRALERTSRKLSSRRKRQVPASVQSRCFV